MHARVMKQPTRQAIFPRELKLTHQHLYDTMEHPLTGRKVKVFAALVKGYNPLKHADQEVYYYKSQGRRVRVDIIRWLTHQLKKLRTK